MEQFEHQLSEEVRRYRHLYDPSSIHYKRSDVTLKSWREIGKTLGKDSVVCRRKWKAIRDKFVRLKKKSIKDFGSDEEKEPAYCMKLAWLNEFIKHRDTKNDFVPKSEVGERRRSAIQQHVPCSTEVSSVSQPAKNRKCVSKSAKRELGHKIGTLQQEIVNCRAFTAVTESCCDEFFIFAQAVADSLRKLPPGKVEATKVKLFMVLGEAHNAAGL